MKSLRFILFLISTLAMLFPEMSIGSHLGTNNLDPNGTSSQKSGPPSLNELASQIFRSKCFDCHSGGRNGDPHHMFGANGFPLPGHENVTLHTITAPTNSRVRMPPNGTDQLTQNEAGIIRRWVENNFDRNIPADLNQAIERGLFKRENFVAPADLKRDIENNRRPRIWNIGPERNIRGASRIGPLSQLDALNRLEALERTTPKNETLIIYCGCCELQRCPNVLLALYILHRRGFTNIKVLNLPHNINDWTSIGGP